MPDNFDWCVFKKDQAQNDQASGTNSAQNQSKLFAKSLVAQGYLDAVTPPKKAESTPYKAKDSEQSSTNELT